MAGLQLALNISNTPCSEGQKNLSERMRESQRESVQLRADVKRQETAQELGNAEGHRNLSSP